jgi:hypothetical protein
MKIWHVCAMFIVFAVLVYHRPVKTPEIASDYVVFRSDKIMKYHDSISSMDSCGGFVIMVRFNDTIHIDSVVDVRKVCTYKMK